MNQEKKLERKKKHETEKMWNFQLQYVKYQTNLHRKRNRNLESTNLKNNV